MAPEIETGGGPQAGPSGTTSPDAVAETAGARPVPHADTHDGEVAEELEHELRESRPVAIGALLAGTALLRVGVAGVSLAIPFDITDLLGSMPALIGALAATQAISEMAFSPVLARWADRLGRRTFLVGGPLLGVVAVLISALATSAGLFAIGRLLEGVSAAAFVPTALGTIAAATSHSGDVRAKASGAFEAANLLGYAGGFVIGPFAYHYLGRWGFLVLACCYLSAGLVVLRWVPRVPPLPVSPLRVIARAIAGPGPIRSFIPAWICCFALLSSFYANLPPLLRRSHRAGPVPGQLLTHSLDERVVSAILVTMVALLVVGIVLWTPFIPRLGSAVTMRRAVPGAWILLGAVLLMNHLPFHFVAVLGPMAILGLLALSGFAPAAVVYLAECSETFAADRSALMAFYTVTLAGGGFVGSLLGGFAVSQWHADGLVVLGTILSVLAFLSLGPVVRYERALLREVGDPQPAGL